MAGTAIEIWRPQHQPTSWRQLLPETLMLVDMVSEMLCRGVPVVRAGQTIAAQDSCSGIHIIKTIQQPRDA